MPTRSMGTIGFVQTAQRPQERTQSIRNGMPMRSMGTIGFVQTPIVPHAPRGNAFRDAPRHTAQIAIRHV
ncbi:hypothetical protein AO067_05925 [Pseudomonas viridiflava ICMP 13104]|uniref:Uncharacterized protein n=1 Tax=Pseudomonas viridiflava ICMP 13104 TaxID=1198305 RepID=A0A0W0HWB3_PSEVI|nr:hypothetical protein AO067_05925 [Pseudomonas viridiflava ICMP 13104]